MALNKYKTEYHSFAADIDPDEDEDDEGVYVGWRRAHDLYGKFIGVELELEADGPYRNIIDAMPEHCDARDGQAPDLESDGSLDEYSGIEIIFPPVPPSALRDCNSYFYRAVDAIHKAAVVGNINNNCGMHMNINRNGWNQVKAAIFSAMINTMPHKQLVRLGGRGLNRWCQQYRDIHFNCLLQYAFKAPDDHHYACEAKFGDTRFECRFPAATTDLNKIAQLSYFFEFLEDFAERYNENTWPELHSFATMWDTFIQWLSNHESKHAKNLAAFFNAEA